MANHQRKKQQHLMSRKQRVRAVIRGTAKRPRLSVYRSNKAVFAQLIDDDKGQTLAHAKESDLKKEQLKQSKQERAKAIGALLAERAKEVKVTNVVFDRGGRAYHGRVRAVAEGAREAGLEV